MAQPPVRALLLEKAETFAVAAVLLCDTIAKRHPLHAVTQQFLRSATSIGANATEAQNAVSKADFYNKLIIALKEARESAYWIRILTRTGRLTEEELIRLLSAITRTLKNTTDKHPISNCCPTSPRGNS